MDAIELFAGAGGLGLGMSKAGFRPVEIVERDRWCCKTLTENRAIIGNGKKIWPEAEPRDIRDIDFKKYENKVALVSGGPPCQPFSLGGKHNGNADERDMWPEAVRVVRETRPKAFVFENVKGLTRASFASYFNYILLQLHYPSITLRAEEEWTSHHARLQRHHLGRGASAEEYRVVFQVINAANFGVPQRRERIVFVGFRHDLNIEWGFPKQRYSLDALLWDQVRSNEYWERHRVPRSRRTMDAQFYARGQSLVEKPSSKPWRTVRDAIGDLPDPEKLSAKASTVSGHRFQPGAKVYPGHTGSPLDEPAKTLKAGVHGVPGGENMLVREDGSVRYFTVRESARLQTFPDKFQLHGAWSEAMRQLGNAVPVGLATEIGKSVREHLNRKAA